MKQGVLSETVRGCTVKIYPLHKPSGTYYRVADYSSGKRQFISKPDEASARAEAKRIAALIAKGDAAGAQMTGADRHELQLIREPLKRYGINPILAANQMAEIYRILDGRDPIQAARYYAATHPKNMQTKTVAEVAAEFLDVKTKARKSADYLADCKYRHGKFSKTFQCNIGDITGPQIADFLLNLKDKKKRPLSDRSRNNFRLSVGTLFEFAKSRKYLPTDWNGMAVVERVEDEDDGEVTTYTPDELRTFLARCRFEFVPFLAIGAFAGLRSAEIERLTWADVFEKPGKIEVKAKKAKTRARRLIPISPNLAKWLEPYKDRPRTESVVPFAAVGQQLHELCQPGEDEKQRPALTWKRNALRHSFISYRLAEVQSAAQVALEAGNSETMIFKNYRDLVTPEAAKDWFSIEPMLVVMPQATLMAA
jgi:integrase